MERERVLDLIILVSAIILFVGAGLIIVELYGAHKYCKSNDGHYKLSINEQGVNHLCDGLKISRYLEEGKTSWNFEKNKNFTIILTNISN
jgi:hypothetical protein